MDAAIPSSTFSCGHTALTDFMMRIVVQSLGNGVDRMEMPVIVPRPATFPSHARLLDMSDTRLADIVTVGLASMDVPVPVGAVMMGCVYDEGDATIIMTWRCQPFTKPEPAPRTIPNRVVRRTVYAAILAVVFMIPSPWELYRVFAANASPPASAHKPTDESMLHAEDTFSVARQRSGIPPKGWRTA